MNQIINVIIRQVVRRVINMGINKGVDHFSRNKDIDPNSPEGKQAQKSAGETSKNAKQTIRMIRRIGRF